MKLRWEKQHTESMLLIKEKYKIGVKNGKLYLIFFSFLFKTFKILQKHAKPIISKLLFSVENRRYREILAV